MKEWRKNPVRYFAEQFDGSRESAEKLASVLGAAGWTGSYVGSLTRVSPEGGPPEFDSVKFDTERDFRYPKDVKIIKGEWLVKVTWPGCDYARFQVQTDREFHNRFSPKDF